MIKTLLITFLSISTGIASTPEIPDDLLYGTIQESPVSSEPRLTPLRIVESPLVGMQETQEVSRLRFPQGHLDLEIREVLAASIERACVIPGDCINSFMRANEIQNESLFNSIVSKQAQLIKAEKVFDIETILMAVNFVSSSGFNVESALQSYILDDSICLQLTHPFETFVTSSFTRPFQVRTDLAQNNGDWFVLWQIYASSKFRPDKLLQYEELLSSLFLDEIFIFSHRIYSQQIKSMESTE